MRTIRSSARRTHWTAGTSRKGETLMPFQVSCPCGNRLNVKDEWEGKRIKCPKCGDMFPATRPEVAPQRSRASELADDEIAESPYSLPFRFGADDVRPRLLY